jgi:hypothetical protein
MPHSVRPFHTLAGGHTHPGCHRRHGSTRSTDGLDIPLWLPANHHHRPWMTIRVATFSRLGQTVWHTTLADNGLPSRRQRPSGTLPSDAQGGYHVPRRPTVDWRTTYSPPRHSHGLQWRSTSVRSRARTRRTADTIEKALSGFFSTEIYPFHPWKFSEDEFTVAAGLNQQPTRAIQDA